MRNKKYGLKIRPTAIRSYDSRICAGAVSMELPQEYELNMREFCEIKDQGYINSCVAFASSLVGECENYRRTGLKEEMSTGNTYGHDACRKGYTGYGMYVDDTMLGLTKIGFVPNHLYDVNVEVPEAINLRKGRDDLDTIGQLLKPSTMISLKVYGNDKENIQSIKEALYKYQRPVVMCSTHFFKEPHCVVIYGWDKNDNFIYQNSWGVTREDPGYGIISIDDIYEAYMLIFEDVQMPFGDVTEKDWYFQEIKNLYFSGLLSGVTDNKLNPNGIMKRCDAVVMLNRIIEKFEKSINTYLKTKEKQEKPVSYINFKSENINQFNDVAKEAYYYDDLLAAAGLGLIKGDLDNNFNPEFAITRAQFATIITRLYDLLLNKIDIGAEWIDLPQDFGYLKLNKKYSDVEPNSWCEESIDKVTNLELMNGVSSSKFEPNNNITRAESFVVIERLCKKIDDIFKKCSQ